MARPRRRTQRAHLAASLRALQEPQAASRPSVLGAKASQVEVELAPSWRAHLAASPRALQEPQAAPRSSVLGAKASQFGAPTRLCKNAFVLDFLAASCAASPLLPAKRQPFPPKRQQPKPCDAHRTHKGGNGPLPMPEPTPKRPLGKLQYPTFARPLSVACRSWRSMAWKVSRTRNTMASTDPRTSSCHDRRSMLQQVVQQSHSV